MLPGVIEDNDDDDIHVRYELTPNNFNCSFKSFCKIISEMFSSLGVI